MARNFDTTTEMPMAPTLVDRNPDTPWMVSVKIPLAWVGISGLLTACFAAMLIYTIADWGWMIFLTSFLIGALAYVVASISGVWWRYAFGIGIPVSVFEALFIWLMPGWAAAITAGVAMGLIVWFIKLENVAIPALERATGFDWNHDGTIGGQAEERVITTVHDDEPDGRTTMFRYEDVTPEQVREIAKRFLAGATGVRSFMGLEKQMAAVRYRLIQEKYAYWKGDDPHNGLALTERGVRYLKGIIIGKDD